MNDFKPGEIIEVGNWRMKHVRTDSRGRHYYKKLGRVVYRRGYSSHTAREQAERDSVLRRRMMAEGSKAELMCMLYGGTTRTDDGKLLASSRVATDQRSYIRHTAEGDFSHLHANPLICK